ncbi:MAG: type I-U CRISPR-associated RAMP protein Csb1/Cas7u [Actinomycetota bacterium]|nr:type I-U CRISPR-associated RAMP protein Csb1/Cas7u [Actinomycetota bacterium]
MTTRHVIRAALQPILGSMFQPTGFPDVGAATFTRFDGETKVPSLLVESVQSMANRLEATAWDEAADVPVEAVRGLPYVRVLRAGSAEFLTSSRLEAHRLASPYVHEATRNGESMFEEIGKRLGLAKDTPLNRQRMAAAVARLDPFCLVHGAFFSHKKWPGQPKFLRAVSGVIEAHEVEPAISGGRKSDRVRHKNEEDGGGAAEGYGSVPFHRTEWTAKTIQASFVVDVELLHSYGLPQPVPELLETLALWEIRSLLDGGMRLRTACDLKLKGEPSDDLPAKKVLDERLADLIPKARDLFGDGEPLIVEYSFAGKKA